MNRCWMQYYVSEWMKNKWMNECVSLAHKTLSNSVPDPYSASWLISPDCSGHSAEKGRCKDVREEPPVSLRLGWGWSRVDRLENYLGRKVDSMRWKPHRERGEESPSTIPRFPDYMTGWMGIAFCELGTWEEGSVWRKVMSSTLDALRCFWNIFGEG